MNSQDPKIRQIDLEIANLQSKTRFVYTGQGLPNFTPEGRAIYIRQDGGTNTTLYVYEGSAWSAK